MITIIGAGPIGCYSAYKLAADGHKVQIYDSKGIIGKPVQCTGLLTSQALKLVHIDKDCILNKIKIARLHAPNGKFIDIDMKKENIVIDRSKFDKNLAELAQSQGVEIFLKHKFESFVKGKAKINNKLIKPEWLIGADGPNSQVAKSSSLFTNRKILVGNQVRAEMKIEDSKIMNIYLGLGCFAWSVPESEKVSRLGVVSYNHNNGLLQRLIRQTNAKILEHQGGLIPLYNPKQKLRNKNVLLIGDAATQVKPTTFGGIVPALLAAKEIDKLENYEKSCNKKVKKDLVLGLKIRKAMDKFNAKDYNELVDIFSKGKPKEIIETYDRDFPSTFILKLMFAKPKLLKFSWKAFWA